MTPREAAGYALTKAYRAIQNGDGWGDASAHIEQAITAAVEEVEDRCASERDSHLETIQRLEAELAEAKKRADRALQGGLTRA